MRKTKNLEWSPTLLDNGAKKTQKEWIAWCKNKKLNPESWRLPTIEEFNDLFRNQTKYAKVIKGIKQDLRNQLLMTSTVFVDFNGAEWPVGRGYYVIFYVNAYYFIIRASRGVREKKLKVKK